MLLSVVTGPSCWLNSLISRRWWCQYGIVNLSLACAQNYYQTLSLIYWYQNPSDVENVGAGSERWSLGGRTYEKVMSRRHFGKDPLMLKSNIKHNNRQVIFLANFQGSQETCFYTKEIGIIFGIKRSQQIWYEVTELETIMQTTKGSSYPNKKSTLL